MPSVAATVVVLHSEAAVLELAEQALRDDGHHVLVTRDPRELLELARHLWVNVVVMDVRLLDGESIVRDLRAAQPHVRIVQEVAVGESPLVPDPDIDVLTPPFTLAHLRKAVSAALGARPAARAAGRRVA